MSLRHYKDKNIITAVLATVVIFGVDFFSPSWYEAWPLYLIPLFFMFKSAKRPYIFSVIITLLVAAPLFLFPMDSGLLMKSAATRITGIFGGWGVSVLLMRSRRLNASLLQARNEMEQRVEDRTAELSRSNNSLQKEIGERVKAEEALSRSEEFIRNILNNVDVGFIVLDHDLRIMSANKAYCSQSNASVEDVIGKYCFEVSHKRPMPCHEEGENCAVKHTFETGEPYMALHKHEDAGGNIIYIETRSFPMRDADNKIVSVIETMHNITERRLLEAEQLKSQKLEAIGTLAGGIAHDFNNLLQGVFGYISLAKLTIDQKDKSLSMLDQAEKALNMSVNLTNQLLTFSKGGRPVKKSIDLKPVIENAAKFALSGSRSNHVIAFDEDLWHVEADNGQIGQVIQNMVLNANEAMPEGGVMQISARNIAVPEEGNTSSLVAGKFVRIDIKDTGMGIPERHLPKIFDPYFTTKQKGSGLGLATSYSIIKNHDGIIDVTSELGKGTTFSIRLPAGKGEENPEAPAAVSTINRKGKILVMDDEEMMRAVVTEMIHALGHDVETAKDGEDAIERVRQALDSKKPFDVAILDLTIKGGLGGEHTVKRLTEIDPEVGVVASSGYADRQESSDYRAMGFSACLNKPYRLDDLNNTINSLL